MKRSATGAVGLLGAAMLMLAGCGGTAAPASSAAASASSAAAASASSRPASPAAGSASAAAPATGSSSAAAKLSGAPVKLGFITPLSGPVGVYGALLKYAPSLVVKATNASGGINGSPLEVVTFDSPNNPAQTVTGMRKLANDDKVFAILGPYFTGEAEVAVPLTDQLKVVGINTSTKPGIVNGSQWGFRLNIPDDVNLPPAVEAFKKVYPNVHKMAIVGDTQTSVTATMVKQIWPKVLQQNGYQVVDTVTFNFATTDFSAIATRIKASGAEGIALSALTPAAPSLLKELANQGLKLPIVSSAHLQTVPIFPKIAGASADGMIEPFFFNPARLQEPKVAKWLADYEAAVAADNPSGPKSVIGFAGEPHYYDIFSVLVNIMRDSGIKADTPVSDAREKIRQGLLKVKNYDGIAGAESTLPNHDITWAPTPLMAKNGTWQPISS